MRSLKCTAWKLFLFPVLVSACLFLPGAGCTWKLNKNVARLKQTLPKDSVEGFVFYYEPNSFAATARPLIKKKLLVYKQEILALMQEKNYTPTIELFFFDSKEMMNKNFHKNAEGVSYAKDNRAVFIYSRNFNGFTKHEISHILTKNLWGNSALWMEEGLATLTDEDLQTENFHVQAKKILKTNDYIPLKKVMTGFNDYNGNWYRYVEAASFLNFIREKYGIAGLKQIWQAKKATITGKTTEDLIAEWETYLLQ
jgi:hypothetical protein